MAEDLVEDTGSVAGQHLLRGWRSVMFAPVGDGQRRRRGSDGVRLAAAVLSLVCCVLVIHYNSRIDQAIVQVINPPPRSITWLVTVVYQAGSFGVVIVLVALALVARRWEIARDIAVSAAGTAAVSGIAVLLLGSRGGRPSGIVINGYDLTFPVLQIALFMAVATAALPYLARGVQRLIEIFIALVALASAVGGHGLPVNVLGSLAIGWGATAVVRLIFGSPLGLPSTDDVRLLLAELGIRSSHVHPVSRQVWGVAKYEATEIGRRRIRPVASVSRSMAGTPPTPGCSPRRAGSCCTGTPGRASRLPGCSRSNTRPTSPCGRARRASPCPRSSRRESRDRPRTRCSSPGCRPGRRCPRLGRDISDVTLDDLYRQLLTLRRARIAHGAISGDALLVDPAEQSVVLADFRNASASASPDRLDRDMAGAMAATAVAVGAERAADAAARCLTPELLEGALRHLQRPALDPALGRSLRGKRGLLEDVRQRAAQAKSIDVPKLVEPRRVSWPTLIMMVGTLIGGWALIGVLIDVSKSFDTVIGADWLWVVVAFVLSQLAYVASAVEGIGSVSGPLPFGRTVAVEVAKSFSALAGGTAAVFATRVRFYQKQGYDTPVALSSGAIMATSSWIAKGVLLLISLPFAWGAIHFDVIPRVLGGIRNWCGSSWPSWCWSPWRSA